MPRGHRGATKPEVCATPERKSHLRLDVAQKMIVEQPFVRSWILDQMAQSPSSKAVHLRFINEVGWRLSSYTVELSGTRELQPAQATVFGKGAGDYQFNTTYQERNLFRSPTDLPGATTGASANLATEGDLFLERHVAAGESWADQRLTADQAAYPPPPDQESNIAMDRVAVTTRSIAPTEALVFRVMVPGNGSQVPDRVGTAYLSGPPGVWASRVRYVAGQLQTSHLGTGEYCIELYGNGIAVLREKCQSAPADDPTGLWTRGVSFRWADPGRVAGVTHTFTIRSERGSTDRIIIEVTTKASANSLGLLASVSERTSKSQVMQFVYRVPKGNGVLPVPVPPPPSRHVPFRFDVRRDARPKIQLSKELYRPVGTLLTDCFSVPFWPGDSEPIIIVWLADIPEGTLVTCRLLNARTGKALTPIPDESGDFYTSFEFEFGMDYFQAEFTLYASEEFAPDGGLFSPTLKAFRAQKNGRTVTVDPGEVEIKPIDPVGAPGSRNLLQHAFGPVSISATQGDPQQPTGSTKVYDLVNNLTLLQQRGDIPFILETEYDETDPALRSSLLEGYIRAPNRTRKRRRQGASYPAAGWSEYQLQLVGKWQRITEQFANQKWNWHWPDHQIGDMKTPYKATYALRVMLNWCGFPASQIDIPDLPIRLWPTDDEMDLFIEPGAPLALFILKILREYLNAALVWDGNAGAEGMWRLISPKRPPYDRVARFIDSAPTNLAAGDRLAGVLPAYGLWADTSPSGGNLQQVPCLVTSARRIEPPEANCVLVTGVSLGDWNSYARLTQWAINVESFNFYEQEDTADPTSADYLGRMVPLYVVDPGLNTPEAVSWAARRYYDYACRATIVETVACPLCLIVDSTDEEQVNPRPLRYYDPVAVAWDENRTWIVRQPTINYRKDFNQAQIVEIQKPWGPFADGPFADS